MKKRILAALLSAAMVISSCLPAYATGDLAAPDVSPVSDEQAVDEPAEEEAPENPAASEESGTSDEEEQEETGEPSAEESEENNESEEESKDEAEDSTNKENEGEAEAPADPTEQPAAPAEPTAPVEPVEPTVPEEKVCTCGTETEMHGEDCVLYVAPSCTCGTETEVHIYGCALYEAPSIMKELLAAKTVEEMYVILCQTEENKDAAFALTAEELEALVVLAKALPCEDEETRTELLDTLALLTQSKLEGVGTYANHSGTLSGDKTWNNGDIVGDLTVSGTRKITLTPGATITLNGTIEIPSSSSLTIICNGTATLQRGNSNSDLFNVLGTLVMSATGGQIVIDGQGKEVNGAAFLVGSNSIKGTSCELKNVTIQNCRREKTGENKTIPSGYAAAIDVRGNGYEESSYTLTMDGCTIQNCYSGHGTALYLHGGSSGIATLTNTTIKKCVATGANTPEEGKKADGQGGTIRTNGGTGAILTLNNCTLDNNWSGFNGPSLDQVRTQENGGSACYGAGIYWNAAGNVSEKETAKAYVNNCTFTNNHANHSGGAIFNETQMQITGNTLIVGNTAYGYAFKTAEPHVLTAFGGGVAIPTYKGGSQSGINQDVTLTLGEGVVIKNNESVNGGGFAMSVQKTADKKDEVTFDVNIDGAVFDGNKATSGGAIHVEKSYSGYYSNVNLKAGTISNNNATDGGAVYVSNVNVNIGEKNSSPEISENKATNGAVVYLNNIPYSEGGPNSDLKHSVTINNGTVRNNTATLNGGAVYVSGGDLTMNGGTITNCTAQNGGAAYVSGGNVQMTDGSIVNCEAIHDPKEIPDDNDKQNYTTGLGGAVYIAGGSMTMLGGEMSNNYGINGGAAYITKSGDTASDFTMISGKMSNNGSKDDAATEYGGAVYVKGGDITIGVAECTGNGVDNDIPKHTHGSYTDLTHPEMHDNTAKFGGALSVSGGNADIHCGTINNNKSDNAGTGMNIFMNGGNLTHDLDASDIGGKDKNGDDDHGIVCVGGSMKVESNTTTLIIKLDYHSNSIPDKQGIEIVWQGEAPGDYWLNLPWCPDDWEKYQNVTNQKTFVGWTETAKNTEGENIRKKPDYFPIGDNFLVSDDMNFYKNLEYDEVTNTYTMHLYAVWAPQVNIISYAYSLDPKVRTVGTSPLLNEWEGAIVENNAEGIDIFEDVQGTAPQSYEFTSTTTNVDVPEPSVPGYTFIGWKMYAKSEKISNWDTDAYDFKTDKLVNEVTRMEQINDRTGRQTFHIWPGQVQQNFGDIVLVAVFTENDAVIKYEIIGPTGCGTVNPTSETIKMATGEATGSKATANDKYKIVGWYTDEACTKEVNQSWVTDDKKGSSYIQESILKPQKGADAIWPKTTTYYVKMELAVADLTIEKDFTGDFDEDMTFVFHVAGKDIEGENFNLDVNIKGKGSVTIKDLLVGTYTITEDSAWAWRYNADQSKQTVDLTKGSKSVTFTNVRNNHNWLDGNSSCQNIFDNGSITQNPEPKA